MPEASNDDHDPPLARADALEAQLAADHTERPQPERLLTGPAPAGFEWELLLRLVGRGLLVVLFVSASVMALCLLAWATVGIR